MLMYTVVLICWWFRYILIYCQCIVLRAVFFTLILSLVWAFYFEIVRCHFRCCSFMFIRLNREIKRICEYIKQKSVKLWFYCSSWLSLHITWFPVIFRQHLLSRRDILIQASSCLLIKLNLLFSIVTRQVFSDSLLFSTFRQVFFSKWEAPARLMMPRNVQQHVKIYLVIFNSCAVHAVVACCDLFTCFRFIISFSSGRHMLVVAFVESFVSIVPEKGGFSTF